MLPPGHAAGGYLAAKAVSLYAPALNNPDFLAWTALFAVAPDLDLFYGFYRDRKFVVTSEKTNHHLCITHAPIFYLTIFLLWIIFLPQYSLYAYAFIIGTLSHLIIDTFASDGTAWLYPLSKKLYGPKMDKSIRIKDEDFLKHWTSFVKEYSKLYAFKAEVILIIIALTTLWLASR